MPIKPNDPILSKLQKKAEDKMGAIIAIIAKANGKKLPSQSGTSMHNPKTGNTMGKSREEIVALITPVLEKGPEAIVDALASAGAIAIAEKAPEGEPEAGKDLDTEMDTGAGGEMAPPVAASGKMPMEDMRKGAVAAAMK